MIAAAAKWKYNGHSTSIENFTKAQGKMECTKLY